MSSLTDDMQRLAAVVWDMHRRSQLWPALVGYSGNGLGLAAKAAGCTPEQLRAYMSGELEPTAAQILGALTALHFPAAVNGAKAKAGAR